MIRSSSSSCMERLADEILGPARERLAPRFRRQVRREDQDRQVRRLGDLVQLVHDVEPVHVRHVQVEQDQIGPVPHVEIRRLARVVGASRSREKPARVRIRRRISMFASSSSTIRMRALREGPRRDHGEPAVRRCDRFGCGGLGPLVRRRRRIAGVRKPRLEERGRRRPRREDAGTARRRTAPPRRDRRRRRSWTSSAVRAHGRQPQRRREHGRTAAPGCAG